MLNRKLNYLYLALGISFVLNSQNTESNNLELKKTELHSYNSTIKASDLKDHLYVYASDEFEGRKTGHSGQARAIKYLTDYYQEKGLSFSNDLKGFEQKFQLKRVQSPSSKIILNNKKVIYGKDYFSFDGLSEINIELDEVVFLGYGIDTKNYSDYKGIDVKGKYLLVKGGEPKSSGGIYLVSGDIETSGWSNERELIKLKREAATKHGAKGIFIYDERNFEYFRNNYIFRENHYKEDGGRMILPLKSANTFVVSEKFANLLYPDLNKSQISMNLNCNLKLSYIPDEESIDVSNVVAYIEGTDKKDEVIVISSHLDHVGTKNGKIYNGADDDGSGTVALLEIAEAFKIAERNGIKPRRTIVFLHVTAEEIGLFGSEYYSNNPIYPIESTVTNLNMDMLGRIDEAHESDSNYIYLIGTNMLSTELHNVSELVNQEYVQMKFDYKYNDKNDPNRFYYRSDHYNFAKHNIPVIFYFNGTHEDYHQPGDTPDKIEYDLLEKRAKLVFHTAVELANRDNKVVVDQIGN